MSVEYNINNEVPEKGVSITVQGDTEDGGVSMSVAGDSCTEDGYELEVLGDEDVTEDFREPRDNYSHWADHTFENNVTVAGTLRTKRWIHPHGCMFVNKTDMLTEYPNPIPGMWCFVGGRFPADIYCCIDAGKWELLKAFNAEGYFKAYLESHNYVTLDWINRAGFLTSNHLKGYLKRAEADKLYASINHIHEELGQSLDLYVNKAGDTMTGPLTAGGGVIVPTGQTLKIGDCIISWDAEMQAVKVSTGLYSEKWLSTRGGAADGGGASGGGGIDEETLAQWLIDNNYATQPWVESKGYITAAALSGYATREWVNGRGFLTGINKSMVEAVLQGDISSHTHSQYLTSHQDISHLLRIDGSNGTAAGVSALLNKLDTGFSTPMDGDYYISQWAEGGTATISYHRRPMSALWSYVKGKADDTYVNVIGDTMTGPLTAGGGVIVPAGQTLKIGDCIISWDAEMQAVKVSTGLYSEKWLSTRGGAADGGGAGGGGGIDEEWLIDNNYATQPWVESKGYITAAALSDYATREWVNSQGFLKNHQSLANYVTLDTAQTITGAKTFALSSVNQLTLRRTAQAGGAFIDYYANNSTVDFWRAGMTSDKDFGFAWHDSLTNAKIDSAGNIYATAFKRVGGTSNQVLMADGGVMTKVSANAVTDSGWASGEIDSKRIPDMSFIAYWNGRYNATSSNLAYCNKGAFGDIVTQSQSSLDDRYVNVSGDTMTGPLFFGNANCKIHNVYDMLVVATNDGTDRVVINSTEFRRSAATPTYNLGSSEYRWANVYANTINVSSTGLVSNLNADMLDGEHGASYLKAVGRDSGTLNLNTFTDRVYKELRPEEQTTSNCPITTNGAILNLWDSNLFAATQLAFGHEKMYFRFKQSAIGEITAAWKTVAFTDSNVASATNADMLDGMHASAFMRSEFAGSIDFNQMTVSGVYRYSDNNTNGPSGDWGQLLVLHGGGDTIAQMAFDYSDSGLIAVRSGNPLKTNGSWGGWNRLARITDNVYSATRLRDTFTLWGQSFYGNNVSGDLILYGENNFNASSSRLCFRSRLAKDNGPYIQGISGYGYDKQRIGIFQNAAVNTYEPSYSEVVSILPNGNVGIGVSSASEKLTVNGWVGTIGASGWYNITYGGGLHMKDSIWIRSYNSKGLYMGTGTIRTDGQIQVGNEGSKFLVDSGGAVSAAGRVTAYGGVTVPKSKSIILGNAEIYQRSDDCLTFWGGASGELYYCEFEGDIRPYNNGTGYIGSFDNYWDAVFSYSINSLRLRVYSDLDNVNTNYGELLWDNTNKAIYTKQGFYSTQWIATKGAAETSDMRLKRVLAPVELSVAQMAAAPLFLFEWRDGEPGVFVGSSAQYWEKVLPQLVMKLGGNRQLFYGQLGVVAGIVNSRAIERLTTRHDRWLGRHETRIQRLERENRELRKRIDELEKNDSLICHTRTEKYITRP